MLTEIWSGGQTGVDRAALDAALEVGFDTGGWMPLGYIAHDGRHPEFMELYNMREHHLPQYPPRTACNVRDTDATLCIALDWESRGEKLTQKMIDQYVKSSLCVTAWNGNKATYVPYDDTVVNSIVDWIEVGGFSRLNVAGNSERSAPGIYRYSLDLLVRVLHRIRSRISQPSQLPSSDIA